MAQNRRRYIGRKHTDILRALYYLNAAQRKALLCKADPKLVKYICECALNVLQGNVPLSKGHKEHLQKHAYLLRKLADPGESFINKKKIIVQRGGFLPALLAPLIGTILANSVYK